MLDSQADNRAVIFKSVLWFLFKQWTHFPDSPDYEDFSKRCKIFLFTQPGHSWRLRAYSKSLQVEPTTVRTYRLFFLNYAACFSLERRYVLITRLRKLVFSWSSLNLFLSRFAVKIWTSLLPGEDFCQDSDKITGFLDDGSKRFTQGILRIITLKNFCTLTLI